MPHELPDLSTTPSCLSPGATAAARPRRSSSPSAQGRRRQGADAERDHQQPRQQRQQSGAAALGGAQGELAARPAAPQGDNRELLNEVDKLATRFGIVTPSTSYLNR